VILTSQAARITGVSYWMSSQMFVYFHQESLKVSFGTFKIIIMLGISIKFLSYMNDNNSGRFEFSYPGTHLKCFLVLLELGAVRHGF
jgi:hypothetical protein